MEIFSLCSVHRGLNNKLNNSLQYICLVKLCYCLCWLKIDPCQSAHNDMNLCIILTVLSSFQWVSSPLIFFTEIRKDVTMKQISFLTPLMPLPLKQRPKRVQNFFIWIKYVVKSWDWLSFKYIGQNMKKSISHFFHSIRKISPIWW